MNEHFLENTRLFSGIPAGEIGAMLDCLQAVRNRFAKGAVIYRAGETVRHVGLVLSGRVQIENNDPWGNRSVLDSVGPGMVFAETYACLPEEPLLVSVLSAEASEVLFLDIDRVLHRCSNACAQHSGLLRNLLMITAQKNLNLSRRIFHTTAKTIRERLTSYLAFQAAHCASYDFRIPFDRQQLADYLSVDRSALSNELSKMQRDGLLWVKKNHFILHPDTAGDVSGV